MVPTLNELMAVGLTSARRKSLYAEILEPKIDMTLGFQTNIIAEAGKP